MDDDDRRLPLQFEEIFSLVKREEITEDLTHISLLKTLSTSPSFYPFLEVLFSLVHIFRTHKSLHFNSNGGSGKKRREDRG